MGASVYMCTIYRGLVSVVVLSLCWLEIVSSAIWCMKLHLNNQQEERYGHQVAIVFSIYSKYATIPKKIGPLVGVPYTNIIIHTMPTIPIVQIIIINNMLLTNFKPTLLWINISCFAGRHRWLLYLVGPFSNIIFFSYPSGNQI